MRISLLSICRSGLGAGLLLLGCAPLVALPASPVPTPDLPSGPETWLAQPGPWGTLRCTRIRLRPPDEILQRLKFPDTGAWGFVGLDWAQVNAILQAASLTSAELAELTDPHHRLVSPDGAGCTIRVSPALRRGLSRTSRSYLYDRLAAYEPNPVHALPFVLPEPARIERANLNPQLRAALEELTFPRGHRRCLVDADLLVPLAADPAELQRLKQLIFTQRSISVEMTRDSLARRQEVASYWAGPQGKSAKGFLRMLDRSPEIQSVDLAHLMPALAQQLLNTFPGGNLSPTDGNCFWLAFNFFNEQPDDRFLAGAGRHVRSNEEEWLTLERDYVMVAPPYHFGDVLGLFSETPAGIELVHMMVYVADDIVLTKNGSHEVTPYVLMRISDVEDRYAWVQALTVRGFRLRRPPAPG